MGKVHRESPLNAGMPYLAASSPPCPGRSTSSSPRERAGNLVDHPCRLHQVQTTTVTECRRTSRRRSEVIRFPVPRVKERAIRSITRCLLVTAGQTSCVALSRHAAHGTQLRFLADLFGAGSDLRLPLHFCFRDQFSWVTVRPTGNARCYQLGCGPLQHGPSV
jgi:hypothetical protein